jgi:hypothetical protein
MPAKKDKKGLQKRLQEVQQQLSADQQSVTLAVKMEALLAAAQAAIAPGRRPGRDDAGAHRRLQKTTPLFAACIGNCFCCAACCCVSPSRTGMADDIFLLRCSAAMPESPPPNAKTMRPTRRSEHPPKAMGRRPALSPAENWYQKARGPSPASPPKRASSRRPSATGSGPLLAPADDGWVCPPRKKMPPFPSSSDSDVLPAFPCSFLDDWMCGFL